MNEEDLSPKPCDQHPDKTAGVALGCHGQGEDMVRSKSAGFSFLLAELATSGILEPPLPVPARAGLAEIREESSVNILVVDDHSNLGRTTALALRSLGCQAFTAQTAEAATRLLAAQKIDGILLDVNLGVESGWEFLSRLSAESESPPVVMFTARGRDEVAAEALRRGAVGCLIKPFSLDDLRGQIACLAEHRHIRPAD